MNGMTSTPLLVAGFVGLCVVGLAACDRSGATPSPTMNSRASTHPTTAAGTKLVLSDADWRGRLSAQQYHILREKGTERAFTGAYSDNHDAGVYRCAGCGTELFRSDE